MFWNDEAVGFKIVWLKKNGIKWGKIGLCGTLLKSVSAVGFSGKAAFLESVYFHSQMIGATSFGLVLGDHNVIVLIFFNKYIVKFSRICFYDLLTIPIIIICSMLKKLCLVFFKRDYNNLSYQKSSTYRLTVLKKHSACMSRICYYSENHFWRRKKEEFYYLWTFPENIYFF